MTEIKQPKIRFKGHINDWEQRKLGDDKDVRDGTHDSPKYHQEGHPLVTSKNLNDYGLDMTGVSLISGADFEAINKRSKVDNGDILFGMIGTIGNPVIVDRSDFAIKNVALIKEGGDIPNRFLIQLLKSSVFKKYIHNENAGNTQKFLGLSKIREFTFFTPTTEEQNKIGEFFKSLDETIALHQQKLEVTRQFKQTMLKKMFPKNGETTPEIRFKGFTDDWEKFKVGNIFNDVILSGNRLPKDSLISGNTPYVIAQVENNGIFKYISKETLDYSGKCMKLFNKNSITISIDNPEAIFVQKEDFYTSNIMRVLYNEKLTYEHHLIISEKIKEKTNGFGWGLKFSGPIIMNTEIELPTDSSKEINFYELQMIGKLFDNINSKIMGLENRIITLNTVKNTMLKKMFI